MAGSSLTNILSAHKGIHIVVAKDNAQVAFNTGTEF